jgi:hypothetical protein
MQASAQYFENGFYKQVLDFYSPFKMLCHTLKLLQFCLNHVPTVYADPHHYSGVRDCMVKMYRTEGFLAFWKGRCQINKNCQFFNYKQQFVSYSSTSE